jgi:hypothetical protein
LRQPKSFYSDFCLVEALLQYQSGSGLEDLQHSTIGERPRGTQAR